jgi:hypothetical protein
VATSTRILAGLEAFQRFGALLLALVAVDGVGGDALALEVDRQAAGAELGADEDQHLLGLLLVVGQQVHQQAALEVGGDRVDAVGDGLGHGVAARHFDQLRRLQHAVGEVLDLVGEGGREQQALALLRQHGEDALDVGDEAHVQHAVGFVEHQHLDLGEGDALLLDVVEQAARRGDDDLAAFAQLGDLRLDVHAAVDADRAQRQVLAVGDDAFMHLHRQFARRRQDQRAYRVAAGEGELLAWLARRCSSGRVKPAVLPVPVWAPPMTSLPDMMMGMAWPGSASGGCSPRPLPRAATRAAGRGRRSLCGEARKSALAIRRLRRREWRG